MGTHLAPFGPLKEPLQDWSLIYLLAVLQEFKDIRNYSQLFRSFTALSVGLAFDDMKRLWGENSK